jgi:glycosyltransferase involved in cell wall biosynthesis
MIGILHGYLLDGSGSNLWTRSVVRALCRAGETVHLVCQEPHPEAYDFIATAHVCEPDGAVRTLFERDTPYEGRCIMHRPALGDTLPVYVWDEYEDFDRVVPMAELTETELEEYLHRNVQVVLRVVAEHGVTVLHANHAVLMSVVAHRVSTWANVPYVIMPHGSALEYAVRADERLRRLGAEAFDHASRVLVISEEVAQRTRAAFGEAAPGLEDRLTQLDLGVDTSAFRPIEIAERASNIARVSELLRGVERGRTAEQAQALRDALAAGRSPVDAAGAAGSFIAKHPDADVETKLASVDWDADPVLVFVGRLIAAKGIHAVLAALPGILAEVPRLRLIVTGHGPLRDALEAFVFALERGDRTLAGRVLAFAESIDAGEPGHLDAIRLHWQQLDDAGMSDGYWAAAARHVRADSVLFTGYLTHREMAWLLPCCDAGIFPSMVLESGPLVFLEALASGVFPIGTYFGGMKVKIDRVAPRLPPGHAELMKVRPDAARIVADIARVVPGAIPLGRQHRATLRRIADDHYDWKPVALRLRELLRGVEAETQAAPRGPRRGHA